MGKIIITKTLEIQLTPQNLASHFAELTADEQADFFNHLHVETTFWKSPFAMQLQAVTDCKHLTDEARALMRKIGEYSE